MRKINTTGKLRRFTALLVDLCLILSMFGGVAVLPAAASPVEDFPFLVSSDDATSGATENVIYRKADPDTTDTYQDALLNDTNGSRYAGRVWTDKTVFAAGTGNDGISNQITLDMATDGYNGSVGFDADFAHVFSALTSTQVVNEYPQSPIDLVIVFDMSGSMGQDTRYGIDPGFNTYQKATDTNYPTNGVLMADRIANSRIQQTLKAINETIDNLMKQNPQNRVAVCGYGANATVLMPLAHWKGEDKNSDGVIEYLSVGGMETLYHPSDLVARNGNWYWMNNRDTCYTVEVNGKYNTTTTSDFNSELNNEEKWIDYKRVVSNNVDSDNVKAFPGVRDPEIKNSYIRQTSREVYDGASKQENPSYKAGSNELKKAMSITHRLDADEYVGYFTNTQGGIYLAYKQLAQDNVTTYTDKLSYNNETVTVPRVPAAIIMSDGGANFAFNPMGTVTFDGSASTKPSTMGGELLITHTKSGNNCSVKEIMLKIMRKTKNMTLVIWINITDYSNRTQIRRRANMETSATSGITSGSLVQISSTTLMKIIHLKDFPPFLMKEQMFIWTALYLRRLDGIIVVYCIAVMTMYLVLPVLCWRYCLLRLT